MKKLQIVFILVAIVFSTAGFSQINLLNDPAKIVLNEVKKVHIYKADIRGKASDYKEYLLNVIHYDGIGRRIHMGVYEDNKLKGTWTYFYQGNTFKCIRTSYCIEDGDSPDVICEYRNNPINTQVEYFETPFEIMYSISERGLISSVTGYDKDGDMDEEILKMKEKMKNSKQPWNVNVHKIPALYLRFEYIPF